MDDNTTQPEPSQDGKTEPKSEPAATGQAGQPPAKTEPEAPKDPKKDAAPPPVPPDPPKTGPANAKDGCSDEEPPEPPLDASSKFWAGAIIISGILLSLWVLIAHWPDKMPTATSSVYCYKAMHVTLIDPAKPKPPILPNKFESTKTNKDSVKADSIAFIKIEAVRVKKLNDAQAKADQAEQKKSPCIQPDGPCCCIQYNVLILLLVAAAGFLGNMVYVSASFAAFVGSGRFRRSWILWYFVKPFTASGLAIFLYLALNNSNAVASNTPINLNGIIAAAALAGLFTDIATQKLKEIFTAIFKPADNRPDKMSDQSVKTQTVNLATMKPEKIDKTQANNFEITGQNLDPKNLIVNIIGKKVEPITVTATLIKFTYTVSADDQDKDKFPLLITDAKGIKIDSKTITT